MEHVDSATGAAATGSGAAAGGAAEPADPGKPRASRGPALVLLAFTLWQSFLTTGLVYGWPALLLVLLDEGVYAGECEPGVHECHERTVALNLVFSLGAMANVAGGVVIGSLVDRLGPRRSFVIGGALTVVGSLIIAMVSASSRFAWPVAFVSYGLGGCFIHMPSFCLGNAFGPLKGMVMSCLVGMFALSAFAFQVARSFYEHVGLAREAIFLAHAAIQACNICGSLWLWPRTAIRPGDTLEFAGGRLRLTRGCAWASPPLATAPPALESFRRVCRIAASARFLAFVVFHTLQLWFSRCLMGWFDAQLAWRNSKLIARTGAGLDVNLHLEIFNATQAVLGLTAIPLFGWLVARFGHSSAPFVATSFLSVLWLAFSLVTSEWALYPLYFFSGWHRQLFFSTFFTFIATEFPIEIFGKLAGLTNFTAGLMSFTQTPLLELVFDHLHGNFALLIASQLAMASLLFAASLAAAVGGAAGCRRRSISSKEVLSEEEQQSAGRDGGNNAQAAAVVAAGEASQDTEEDRERCEASI